MEYAIARLAVHTNEQVLHPAAMLDYRARLRKLVAAGASYEAALLWGSALEVQHVPPIPADDEVSYVANLKHALMRLRRP